MAPSPPSPVRTTLATVLAMVAFAANSILCRLALHPPSIDAIGFTAIRLLSGALTLLVIARLSGRRRPRAAGGTWTSGAALFTYALAFTFAYLRLDVGTGALILFALVQATMIGRGIATDERPTRWQGIGIGAALAGLVYLVSPGLTAPAPLGAAAMALAGVAWGIYSLRGRRTPDPLVTTTDNFLRSVPLVLIPAALVYGRLELSLRGGLLAATSGALASGLGYVVWYVALRGLSNTRAAAVQLTVPVIAAAGGVALLGETLSLRLAVAAVAILGGVALTWVDREGARKRD